MTSNPNIGQEQALRECPNPWCVSRADGVQKHHIRNFRPDAWTISDKWRVDCSRCEIMGPLSDTREHAIAAWNQRSTPTPAQVEPVAWVYEIPSSGVWRLYKTRYVSPQAVAEGWTETPLYAHPPAAGDSEAGRLREALALLRTFRDFAYSGSDFYYPAGSLQRLDAALAGSEGER